MGLAIPSKSSWMYIFLHLVLIKSFSVVFPITSLFTNTLFLFWRYYSIRGLWSPYFIVFSYKDMMIVQSAIINSFHSSINARGSMTALGRQFWYCSATCIPSAPLIALHTSQFYCLHSVYVHTTACTLEFKLNKRYCRSAHALGLIFQTVKKDSKT